jgi:hypothetical protein
MQGIPYPVLGIDNYGNEQMMYPGMDYQFPGNIVTEYPQMLTGGVLQPGGGGRWLDSVNAQFNNQYGGDPSIPKLDQAKKGGSKGYSKQTRLKTNRQYTSKNIQSSINDLMIRNETLYGPSGKKRYKPDTKYKMGGWLDQYQAGGAAGKPIYVSSPLDPRYQAYSDSLSLYNNYKKRVDTKGGTLRDTFAIDDVHFTPGAIYNETDRIKPTGIEWHEGGYGRSGDTFIPAYKKPVQQVVVKKVVKKTPEQKARELKPIESKLTPIDVAPEPSLYKPVTPAKPQSLYKKTQEPNMPSFYWQFDPVSKQWNQVSEREYNLNSPAQQKKAGGSTRKSDKKLVNYSQNPNFVKTSWLDNYL